MSHTVVVWWHTFNHWCHWVWPPSPWSHLLRQAKGPILTWIPTGILVAWGMSLIIGVQWHTISQVAHCNFLIFISLPLLKLKAWTFFPILPRNPNEDWDLLAACPGLRQPYDWAFGVQWGWPGVCAVAALEEACHHDLEHQNEAACHTATIRFQPTRSPQMCWWAETYPLPSSSQIDWNFWNSEEKQSKRLLQPILLACLSLFCVLEISCELNSQ